MDLKSARKRMLGKFLEVLSSSWHSDRLQTFFLCWLANLVCNERVQKSKDEQTSADRETHRHKNLLEISEYLSLLQMVVSLLVWGHLSIFYLQYFIPGCTRKYHFLIWKVLQDILPIFLCDSLNFCCTHSQIWVSRNLVVLCVCTIL